MITVQQPVSTAFSTETEKSFGAASEGQDSKILTSKAHRISDLAVFTLAEHSRRWLQAESACQISKALIKRGAADRWTSVEDEIFPENDFQQGGQTQSELSNGGSRTCPDSNFLHLDKSVEMEGVIQARDLECRRVYIPTLCNLSREMN
ncbi:unnamed protein product [Cyprideis torosa]|uniref:Uncharacterized protein n=1 Tax=Cyprideis torosa TaxID=163714 RepID=A0A7R8ZQN1_9CRUS|nr:unnamed protein product [Cyprideis torosa]CAG0896795.1 unnamed protein product [Cyprideis torosa]